MSKNDSSVEILFTSIKTAVQRGELGKAESLRDKLLKEAPMALSEIIASAELIEEAKAATLDQEHISIWESLYSELSIEEKNSLFYSMKKTVLPEKRALLQQGQPNDRLFFIDSGEVAVVHSHEGKNVIRARLSRGDLIGEYSFTSISLCSASVVTQSEVKLYILENIATDEWHDDCPGLYDKVVDFCIKHGNIEGISYWKRREHKKTRYAVTGPINASLLGRDGKKTNISFRGSLSDISTAGCAFDIRIANKKTARALLIKKLHLVFSFSVGGNKKVFEKKGTIVKVSFYMHKDYCLHIQFDEPIESELLDKILVK